jgi:hypothetical protein
MFYLFLIFIALLIVTDILNCDTELVSSFLVFSTSYKKSTPPKARPRPRGWPCLNSSR